MRGVFGRGDFVANGVLFAFYHLHIPWSIPAALADIILPPRFGRSVAAGIPNARFDVMPGEAHQPFQEVPDEFNARVEDFWREVEARG